MPDPDAPAPARPTEEPAPSSVLPSTSRGRFLVLAIIALALVVRGGLVVRIHDGYAPLTDALHFDGIASSLAAGDGYGPAILPPATGPSALRAPLYPLALAGVYVVFGGHSWTAGLLLNAVIGTIGVALIGLVAAQIWSRRIGAIAMALAAVHPTMLVVGSSLQLEPLLVTLTMGALAAALQHRRSPQGLRWPLITGVLIGLAILTRELGFLLIPPLGWLVWTAGRRGWPRFERRALAAPAALVLVALAVVLPWTIRNAIRFHAFVPVSTSSGFGLAGTYNETSMRNKDTPAQWMRPYDDPKVNALLLSLHEPDEVDVDVALRRESIDLVRDNPSYPAKVIAWNAYRLFDLDGGDFSRYAAQFLPYPPGLTRLAIVSSWVVLGLAILGALLSDARRAPRAVWLVPLSIFAFMLLFLPANIRYRASLEPFFVMLASLAIAWAFERFQHARSSPAET